MNVYDRTTRPARFVVKFYRTNPEDVDPPLDTIAVVDLTPDVEQRLIAQVRKLAKSRKYKRADSWELVERTGIYWDAFDDGCGSWEWTDKTLYDSWQEG